jgi:hypothetical protein
MSYNTKKAAIKGIRPKTTAKNCTTYQATKKSQQYPDSVTIFIMQGILPWGL